MNARDSAPGSFYSRLTRYRDARIAEFPQIPPGRQVDLRDLAGLSDRQREASGEARITFICTHNSWRSHLAQIWAEVAAAYHDVSGVASYSGGTEATTFDRRAVAALRARDCRSSSRRGAETPGMKSGLVPWLWPGWPSRRSTIRIPIHGRDFWRC